MVWTRSACPGALSLLTDKAKERQGRSMIGRCAVRRKRQVARGQRTADSEPILLPSGTVARGQQPQLSDICGQWPDTRMARACHDLRTPLNAVIGFTDLMRSELHGPIGDRRYAEYLDHIAASARALLKSAEATLALAERASRK